MRAGPELGKKSAGVLRREGSLPGGRVCAIRLISDRVQFRLRTRSYGPRSSPDSIVPIVFVRFGSIWFGDRVCQRKKAKQKHRNSASVGVDSRTVVGSRDWKDANSGLARIVWYAFDYRVPRVVLVRNNARQQCLCLALSARKCSVVIQVERRESKRVPVQDHRKNRMKQSARKK